MNTTESAAAVSGDPAAAESMIQTKMTGSSLPKRPVTPAVTWPGHRRHHLLRGGLQVPLRQVCAEYRFHGKVRRQLAQVGPGLRGVGGRGTFVELLQR